MYRYEDLKPRIFTEEGVVMYVAVRDYARRLIEEAGAFKMDAIIRGKSGLPSVMADCFFTQPPAWSSLWLMLACVDRMVESGELREVTPDGVHVQDRVFVAT